MVTVMLVAEFLKASICFGAIILLIETPAAVSHSCFIGHKKTSRERRVELTLEDDAAADYAGNYKTELQIALAKAKISAKKLKKFIEKQQLKNVKLRKECKKRPSLRGVPQVKSGTALEENWVEVLSDDFRRLATVLEFVRIAITDTDDYSSWFDSLHTNLATCLCYVEQLSDSNQLELSHDVTAAVVPRMYKNMADQAVRDRRNCVLVRDVHDVLEDMQKWYK